MLQSIRSMAHSWPVKILLSLLIVSFGIWGIGDMFRGNPQQKAVATVGSQKITVQQLEQQFQRDLPKARKAYGEELTTTQARQMGVLERSLDALIKFSTIDQEVARLGLNISDRLIIEDLAKQPIFRDKSGKFSAALWHNALGRNGLSEKMFMDDQKKTAARRLLLQQIVNNEPLPALLVNDMYKALGAQRIVEVLSLKNDSMDVEDKPSDKELQDFYEAHKEMFRAPEYRTMTVGVLSSAALEKSVKISDEDLRNAYDQRTEEFSNGERRDIVQVVLHDEAEAKAVAEAAKKADSLDQVAKERKLDVVSLNKVDERSVLPELYTTLFALEAGQISEPVKSSLGWHVVQVKKIYPAGVSPFDEVKDRLREILKREKVGDLIAKNVNDLDDSLAANKPLEDIADALRLRLIKVPAIDSAFAFKDSAAKMEAFPAKEQALKAAFQLESGETSQILDDRAGNYVVIRVDGIAPAHIQPFDEVKASVLSALIKDKKAEIAKAKAEEIAKAVRSGKALSSYAVLSGVEVRFSKPISSLGETDPDLSPVATEQILKMKKGDVVPFSAPDRQYVFRLKDIHEIDPVKASPAKLRVIDNLKDNVPIETADEFEHFLHRRTPVLINEDLLNTLKNQGS